MFQSKFVKIDEFGWWYLEIISADVRTKFTSTEFKDNFQTRGVHLRLAALEHQWMNGKFKVTCRTLRTLTHSLMVHVRVLEECMHFALMYTTDNIFPVLPSKDLINKYGNPKTPFKLATGTKPSVSHLRVLLFPCVVRKSIAYVGTK